MVQLDNKYENAVYLLDQLAIHQSYWNINFTDGVIWISLSSKDSEELEDELENELYAYLSRFTGANRTSKWKLISDELKNRNVLIAVTYPGHACNVVEYLENLSKISDSIKVIHSKE